MSSKAPERVTKQSTSRSPDRKGGEVAEGAPWLQRYTSGYVTASEEISESDDEASSKSPLLRNSDAKVSYEAPKPEL